MAMNFSDDMLFLIFSWLPAKTIHRFKCINKAIKQFTFENLFASQQSRNMNHSAIFIHQKSDQRFSGRVELLSLPGQQFFSGLPKQSLNILSQTAKIIASSNGLLLCRNTAKAEPELFICNPVTQSLSVIPIPESLKTNYLAPFIVVFDCNKCSSVDDYVLIMLDGGASDWPSTLECKIYFPVEGVWKDCGSFYAGSRTMEFDMPVLLDHEIYFVSDCFGYLRKGNKYYKPYIASYNMKNQTSRIVKLPNKAKQIHDSTSRMGIFKWGKKSICLIKLHRSEFTVWVLKDKDSSLWIGIIKKQIRAMGLNENIPLVSGFTVVNGDSLVFASSDKVYLYGLKGERDHRAKQIGVHRCGGSYVSMNSYSNTLCPCGDASSNLSNLLTTLKFPYC